FMQPIYADMFMNHNLSMLEPVIAVVGHGYRLISLFFQCLMKMGLLLHVKEKGPITKRSV
ncbi:hypothetical protein ACJX0J_035504, partial [Zea mays]